MIPDFGENVVEHDGVKLSCRYYVPGLTLHDLVMIFERAHNDPNNNRFAGDPSKWPDVAGVKAVTDAILEAIYKE
jgi:hypothetical protein